MIALEWNEECHMAFIDKMGQYEPEELGFLDKISKNNKMPSRFCGCATQNHCAEMKQVFIQGRHLSATALLTIDGIAALTVVEGCMTKVKYICLPWTTQCACYG